MNYTENYHLPQWVKEDRIMMEDFNQAMANIDTGLSANAQAAAELPYVVGSYTGNGGTEREFNLGFRPSFVLICSSQNDGNFYHCGMYTFMAGPNVTSQRLYMTDTGFRISLDEKSAEHPRINTAERVYDYIAFR